MKKIRVMDDGNLSGWLRTVLCVMGAGIVYWSVQYAHSMLLMSVGLLLAAIGGYASRARMLKIKPFDNSYKKARDSYKVKDEKLDEGK
ncbi:MULTISPECIES: hypothetical protein [Paraburkholderia]|uniref:hypothetical protein n=1 Tax=Paraburkholderia TaxID=1822464 RepID=UPI00225B8556|nr:MULTISPECIES: hypothetical protein [Paraburkholderia]MCX4164123.1 hypothetical protein [Paraburkholderia megapolitana]MDN7159617.1 hypothetical protein [Paraburkholderia sp. CHISQ3]MDQ6496664.1 hypothetical protein [Paraburkholderia megapolitana]